MINYGFFNSVGGDRTYDADDISRYFLKLISNGVFATPASCLKVTASSGMTVSVGAGWAFINCKWLENTSEYLLTLDAADSTYPRTDRIVVGLDTAERTVNIYVKKGTAASPTKPPELIRNDEKYELCLATVIVPANSTRVNQSAIFDNRADTELCGYVTGLIKQIDTTDLFSQFTAAFNEWFTNLQETLVYESKIQRLYSTFITTEPVTATIPLNISGYDPNTDTLSVFVNGFKMIPDKDYTLNNSEQTLSFTQNLDIIGTTVLIEVLRNTGHGSSEPALVSALIMANTTAPPIFGDLEVSEQEEE